MWEASGTKQTTNNGVNVTVYWNSIILFNSQSKILREVTYDERGEGGSVVYRYSDYKSKYEIIDNKTIILRRIYNSQSNEGVLSYKIVGNNLILEYISGDKPSILNGENRIVYTIKSKGDIVEYPYGGWEATASIENHQTVVRLSFQMDGEFQVWGKRPGGLFGIESYRYNFTGNTIKLFKTGNTSTSPDCTLSFKNAGTSITFEYISGEKPQFISIFNGNKATYSSDMQQ